MGEVVIPNRLRGDDNSLRERLVVCAITNCRNQTTNKCPICSIHFCYEHIKSHDHPNEFPPIQKE
jgi:predicted nucleic acid binding AN1-type Zn finger protein